MMLAGPRSWLIERFVVEARRRAKVPIDWHMAGGRAIILSLPGDEEKALDALDWWLPALEEAARQEKARATGRGDDWAGELCLVQRGGIRPPKPEDFPPGAIAWDPDGGFYMSEPN